MWRWNCTVQNKYLSIYIWLKTRCSLPDGMRCPFMPKPYPTVHIKTMSINCSEIVQERYHQLYLTHIGQLHVFRDEYLADTALAIKIENAWKNVFTDCSVRFVQNDLIISKCEAMKVLSLSIIQLESLGCFWLITHHTESLSYVSVSVLSHGMFEPWYINNALQNHVI